LNFLSSRLEKAKPINEPHVINLQLSLCYDHWQGFGLSAVREILHSRCQVKISRLILMTQIELFQFSLWTQTTT